MQTSNQNARKGGFAMIMVLCIGALFVALSTALLFAASVLVANANRQLIEQEVYGMASTFSERLNTDLTEYDKNDAAKQNPFGDIADEYLHSSFYSRAFEPITFDCDPDELSDVGGASDLSVTLAKREGDDEDVSGGKVVTWEDINTAETKLTKANADDNTILDYYLDVSVTAKLKNDSFTYTQSYECNSHYQMYYTFDWGGYGNERFTYNMVEKEFVSRTNVITLEKAVEHGYATEYRETGNNVLPTAVTFTNRATDNDGGEANP